MSDNQMRSCPDCLGHGRVESRISGKIFTCRKCRGAGEVPCDE